MYMTFVKQECENLISDYPTLENFLTTAISIYICMYVSAIRNKTLFIKSV